MTDQWWPNTAKWLTPQQLINVLEDLDPTLRIVPNRMGNLSAYNDQWDYQGRIDFLFEGTYEAKDAE